MIWFTLVGHASAVVEATHQRETFDIGEDTGTPVLEDYVDQMPFRFTGTLKRFTVVLEPLQLSDQDQHRFRQELAKAMMAVQ